jgi:DNA (cytosine-5)-methyltransferase 1
MKIEVIEMFPGGGTLLEALTTGLKQAGAEVTVGGLIELEPRYLAISAKAHPEASTWTGSAGEWHPAELSSPRKAVRLFAAGIPCTGASKAGLSKNGLSCAEEHPDVGYLFLPTIHYIRLHKPEIVVLENTDTYRGTLSARLLREALAVSGYTCDERVVNPLKEFAAPSQRKRWVLVASRIGRFPWIYEAKAFNGTLAAYLDPETPEDDAESATPEQVAAASKYCQRKKAEGCGFEMSIVGPESDSIGVLPKSYGKRQHTATYVRTKKSYRMIRPREIARLHGFKRDLFAGLPKTTQYELYGQGVVASPFICLGECIARFLSGELAVAPAGQLELFAG